MALAELLCTDLTSVEAALEAGADRLELCAALEVGGVTPGIGFVRAAVELAAQAHRPTGVVTLIRPRRGDFVLDGPRGLALLRAEVAAAQDAGTSGVAVGVLTPGGEVDGAAMEALVEAAGPAQVTFHRAIDHVADQDAALHRLVEVGVARLLTSGAAESALAGAARIRQAVAGWGRVLEIVAAGGIHGGNAAEVLAATEAPAIHGSCSHLVGSPGAADEAPVTMGSFGASLPENMRSQLDLVSARSFVAAARASFP